MFSWTTLEWFNRYAFVVNVIRQISHWYFFVVSTCLCLMCFDKTDLLLNSFPHVSHAMSLMVLWTELMCSLRTWYLPKHLLHFSHLWDFIFSWISLICWYKVLFNVNALSQRWHFRSFTLLCIALIFPWRNVSFF